LHKDQEQSNKEAEINMVSEKSQKRNSVVRGKFRQIKSYTHVVFIFLQKKVRACDTPSLLPHLTVLSHYLPFSHSGYYLN